MWLESIQAKEVQTAIKKIASEMKETYRGTSDLPIISQLETGLMNSLALETVDINVDEVRAPIYQATSKVKSGLMNEYSRGIASELSTGLNAKIDEIAWTD